MRKLFRKTIIQYLAAMALGFGLSFLFFQYQLSQDHQTGKALVTAALTQNNYYSELLSLDDQANKVLVDCLNQTNCDKQKAANDIVAINVKRDEIIAAEKSDLEKAKMMLK